MNDSIEALGWTLVHFCWQAAVIAILYRLLDSAFSKSRSNLRYALALASLMSMLLAGALTLGYEARRLAQESVLREQASAAHTLPECSSGAASLASTTGFAGTIDRGRSSIGHLSSFAVQVLPEQVMPWIDAIWLVGVLALSLRMLGGWMVIHRLQQSTRTKAPTSVYAAFVRLSIHMGIRRKVELLMCSRIAGPVAMGAWRSTILLPFSALTHLSTDQLEVVLAHELAHIRRRDYLWNMAQSVVETLFFFHPVVWWLGGRSRQLRELCCDDAALECCGDPVVYATALLQLEEQRAMRLRLAMALGGNGKGSNLKARIVHILDGTQGERSMKRREAVPLVLVGVTAFIGIFLLPLPRVSAGHAAVLQEHSLATLQTAAVASTKHQAVTIKSKATKLTAATAQSITAAPDIHVAEISAPVAPAQQQTFLTAPIAATISTTTARVAPVAAVSSVVSLRPKLTVAGVREFIRPVAPAMTYTMAQGSEDEVASESYIKQMQELGYNDLNQLIAMKIQGITPEYARSMAKTGYAKPSADDLISLKVFGITPDLVEKMRAEGIAPASLHDMIPYKIFKVTPEYAAGMKAAGFSWVPANKLLQMRIQNVTPEYAKAMRQRFPDLTVEQLLQMKIFRIDEEFIASAKSHGFDTLSIDKLLKLRMSGLLDDNSVRK